MRLIILFSLLIVPFFSYAQAPPPPPPDLEQAPDTPNAPMPIENGESMEPDITIIRKGKKTIHEYRSAGQLYMIKVIPDIGPPYYFIDTNGDGRMDVRRSDLERGANVNQWKLLEWK